MDDVQRCFELLQAGDIEGIRRVLDEKPVVSDARDQSGVSLLMHTIYRGQHELAEAIAANKSSLDIFEAASLGRTDALKQHLRDASGINAYSKDGFTALHFASYFRQPEAARLLLENGARVDSVANNPTKVM